LPRRASRHDGKTPRRRPKSRPVARRRRQSRGRVALHLHASKGR